MTVRRTAAIEFILGETSLAWATREVDLLWGRPHRQVAQTASVLRTNEDMEAGHVAGR